MDTILGSLFNLTLFPFTSGTYFMPIPFCLCFISMCFGLVRRFMTMDFKGLPHME